MIELDEYAELSGIDITQLTGKSKTTEVVTARWIYWLYLKSIGFGFSEIGRMCGRSHCDVIHGIKRIKDFINANDAYTKMRIESIGLNINRLTANIQ